MKKLVYMLPVAMLILAATMPAMAQDGGCVNSPENPTAILALVGLAAAGINQLRIRFRRK